MNLIDITIGLHYVIIFRTITKEKLMSNDINLIEAGWYTHQSSDITFKF